MSKIIGAYKVIRKNWKKSTLAALILAYGLNKIKCEYENKIIMQQYCEDAIQYGEIPLPVDENPFNIVVILNPAANRKKAKNNYEKYCAPIINLSGARVNVINTDKEGSGRIIAENLPDGVDAVIIAGGDGTVSEVITGLVRKANNNLASCKNLPIGIIPLGRTNSVSRLLHAKKCDVKENSKNAMVRLIAEASSSIVHGHTKLMDIMEIRNSLNDESLKPVYAADRIHIGAFRNADHNRDKYWYFNGLRNYVSYVLGSYNRVKPVQMEMRYSSPCDGCKKCYANRLELHKSIDTRSDENSKSLLRWLMPSFKQRNQGENRIEIVDYNAIDNDKCGIVEETIVNTVDMDIRANPDKPASLIVRYGPEVIRYVDFVKEGWKKIYAGEDNRNNKNEVKGRQIFLTPKESNVEKYLSIDNDEYEVVPITVTILPRLLAVFQPVN